MRRRVLLILAGLACLALLALSVLVMLPPRQGITKGNFERIEIGMTMEEVKEIFAPAEPFDTTPVNLGEPAVWQCWKGNDRSMALVRYVDGLVVLTEWEGPNDIILDKIRHKIRRH